MVRAHPHRPLDFSCRPAAEQPGAGAGDGFQFPAPRAAGEGQSPLAARLLLVRLGLISLYLFLILTFTGVLLMFYYVPSTDHAYNVMKDLQFVVSAGLIMRNMHR